MLCTVNIGRSLARIEDTLRSLNATAIYPERDVEYLIEEALREARKLVKELDRLKYAATSEHVELAPNSKVVARLPAD